MLRLLFLACCFLLLTGCGGDAEPVGNSDIEYVSPVDYEIVLAGNFGEPRPWHFHGGIDIKTGNQEGKQIFSIADGYVSHVTVNKHGFGNAIYVAHPDGLTSVYCHLKRFADVYEKQIERKGWRDTLDVRFAPGQFPVRSVAIRAIPRALISISNSTTPAPGSCATRCSSWPISLPTP